MAKPVVLLLAALTLVLGATAVTASTDDGEPGQDLGVARTLDASLADEDIRETLSKLISAIRQQKQNKLEALKRMILERRASRQRREENEDLPSTPTIGPQDATQDEDILDTLSKLISAIRQQTQKKFEALKRMILERRASRQRRESPQDLTSSSTPAPQEVAPSTDAAPDASATTPPRPVQCRCPRKEEESSEEESSERKGRRGKGRNDKKDKHAGKWSGSVTDVIFGGRGEVRLPSPAPDADDDKSGGRRGHGRKKKDDKWAFIAELMARRKTTAAPPATDATAPAGV